MRTLLIRVDSEATGGREQLSSILNNKLRDVIGDELDVFQLLPKVHTANILGRLIGRIDGINFSVEQQLLRRLIENSPERVIIDGSNLGRIARLIKRLDPNLPIITFYHNIEARFFFDALRATPSFHAAGVLAVNLLVERWATRFSDKRIMLNDRDGRLLRQLYGHPATDLLPMALRDAYDPTAAEEPCPLTEPYALFVGGAFYANVEGMAWYGRTVAPQSPIRTIVIGRGMEAHRARLEQWGGVTVIGEVDNLAPWYAHAQIIVAPILSGSGMKTKTAEALMHGKSIAGSPEAFVGYEVKPTTNKLKVCVTSRDFLQALSAASGTKPYFDPEMRWFYEQHHSANALQTHLYRILSHNLDEGPIA